MSAVFALLLALPLGGLALSDPGFVGAIEEATVVLDEEQIDAASIEMIEVTGVSEFATLVEWSNDGALWQACDGTDIFTCEVIPEAGTQTITVRVQPGNVTDTLPLYAPSIAIRMDLRGSGVQNIRSPTLEAAGASVLFEFNAYDDASDTKIVCDTGCGDLDLIEGGTDVTFNDPYFPATTTLNPENAAIRFASGDYFQAATSTPGDVGDEDFVIALLVYHPGTAGSEILLSKYTAAAGEGWWIEKTQNNQWRMVVDDGPTQVADTSNIAGGGSPGPEWHGWGMLVYAFDGASSTGIQGWWNMNPTGGGSNVTSVGSLTTAAKLTVGAFGDGTSKAAATTSIAWAKMWTCASCITQGAQQTAIAFELTQSYFGALPELAAGATTLTVSSTTSYGKLLRSGSCGSSPQFVLAKMAYQAPVPWQECVGSTLHTGLYATQVATHTLLQSEDLSTTWAANNVSVSTNASVSPDGSTKADDAESPDGAGSVPHYFRQAVTHTAALWTESAYCRRDREASYVWLRNATIANGAAWFDVATCVEGTKQAGITRSKAEPLNDTWCRVQATYTGTAASHDLDIGFSNADNVTDYDDGTDSNVDMTCTKIQAEAYPKATQPMDTTTASFVRAPMRYIYPQPNNYEIPATTQFGFLAEDYDVQSAWTLAEISNLQAGSFGFVVTGDLCNASGSAGYSINSPSDCVDGNHHVLRVRAVEDDVRFYYDGVQAGVTDTNTTAITGSGSANLITFGGRQNGTSGTDALFTHYIIWPTHHGRCLTEPTPGLCQ